MNYYELTTILSEKNAEKETAKISKIIKDFIAECEGEIKTENLIGRKKLAYPIKKNEFGTFLVFQFLMKPHQIKTLYSKLKTEPEIIRFLIVSLPKITKTKEGKIKIEKQIKGGKKKETIKKPKAKAKKISIKKTKIEKPEIVKEIESEEERMKKLEEELDKILEE